MSQKKLTLADMPKPYLVGILDALDFPVDEVEIAGAIIRHRLHRSGIHAGQYTAITEAAKKTRQIRKRRELEIQAQCHAVNCSTLFESARKLAGQYGLTEKYFKPAKAESITATVVLNIGQTTRRPHHET